MFGVEKNRAGSSSSVRSLGFLRVVSFSTSETSCIGHKRGEITESFPSLLIKKSCPNKLLTYITKRKNSPFQKMTSFWIMVFLLVLCLKSTTAELASIGRFGTPRSSNADGDTLALNYENNTSQIVSAKEYLGVFGWIEPTDWTSVSPRFNKTGIEEGGLQGQNETNNQLGNANETLSNQFRERFKAMGDEEFLVALSNFQHANGLNITGVLDEETMMIMTQLRCGVPDLTVNPNITTSTVDPGDSNTESVTITPQINDIIADSGSAEGSGRAETPTTAFPYLTTFSPRMVRKRRFSEPPLVHRLTERAENAENMENETEWDTNSTEEASMSDVESIVSEAELSTESRKEDMEEILSALRKEKMARLNDSTINDTVPPPRFPELLERIVLYTRHQEHKRTKRSGAYRMFNRANGWGLAFPRRTITWRLVREWPSSRNQFMTSNEVWFTVKLAFRMWSEILPRNFLEDNVSPVSQVDVLIGFGINQHNRCPVSFGQGPLIQEYAHAWALPKAEIHFNDEQPFVPVSWIPATVSGGAPQTRSSASYPISLLKVAIHEIGHTLGLSHNENRLSIMNPYYKPFQGSKNMDELSTSDRNSIKAIYGECEIPFDVAFDWLRQERSPDGVLRWKYNTYFFRRQWYWLYENSNKRPRYGDPKPTAYHWSGIMQLNDPHRKIDGIVHIREWNSPLGPIYFFKGDVFIEYNSRLSRAMTSDGNGNRYPRPIRDLFPGVPFAIDTVFYKTDERILYFFKNHLVYRFHWPTKRLASIATIAATFPGWGGASPLPSNIDAAYYSYTEQAYFFYKGHYFWKMAGNPERLANPRMWIPRNAVGPRRRISSNWKDICDVGETELLMDLPVS
ncbi:matrix metalloproteinase-21-like [Ciona intestinalis]